MNRYGLLQATEREGICRSSFALDGGVSDEMYVLAVEEGGWSVYFAERGKRIDEERYETEDEACDELFLRLLKDPTTRKC